MLVCSSRRQCFSIVGVGDPVGRTCRMPGTTSTCNYNSGGQNTTKKRMNSGELVVVTEGVVAWLIGSEASASSYQSMSLASRSLPSGPMAQSDIVGIIFLMNKMYPV